jgi:hypothetical protein
MKKVLLLFLLCMTIAGVEIRICDGVNLCVNRELGTVEVVAKPDHKLACFNGLTFAIAEERPYLIKYSDLNGESIAITWNALEEAGKPVSLPRTRLDMNDSTFYI